MEHCRLIARNFLKLSQKASLAESLLKAQTLNKANVRLNHVYFNNFVSCVWTRTPPTISYHLRFISQPFYFQYSTVNEADGQSKFELAFDDFQALIKSGDIRIFDVREPAELIEYGCYPGAVNVPLGELQHALELSAETFRKTYGTNKPHTGDSNIVFCCLGGVRSMKALNIAKELGFLKARHYKGGWEEYHGKMGLPFKQNPSS